MLINPNDVKIQLMKNRGVGLHQGYYMTSKVRIRSVLKKQG